MGIDTSIYQAIKPVEMPSFADSAKNAMTLSQLGMQNQQMQYQMQQQQAMRQLAGQFIDANGNFDRAGYTKAMYQINPQMGAQAEEQFGKAGQATAEMQAKQAEAANAQLSQAMPLLDYVKNAKSEEDRVKMWPQTIATLKGIGLDTSRLGDVYPGDDTFNKVIYPTIQNMKDNLANQKTKAEIGDMAVKRNSDLYGSRSPNAELSSQYGNDVKPVKASQIAMQQMIDNYSNHSPQGDASLLLNAYKIKFPDKPNAESIDELAKSESTPAQWKTLINKRVNGLLPDEVRNDLMRDGISTYRSNYGSYQNIAKRYKARAEQQNVNDPTLTYEPALDQTFHDAMGIQKQIGGYTPPTERGGFMAGVGRFASNVLGVGDSSSPQKSPEEGTAYAASPKVTITPHDASALQWLQDPKNAALPQAFKIRSMLKAKGLLK